MKSLKKFIILSTLVSGMNVHAFNVSNLTINNVKTVQLFDGSIINVKKDVEEIQFAYDRTNKVDFIQLKEGTVIDSYDVQKLILNDTINTFPSKKSDYSSPVNHAYMIGMRMGDGSGG